MEQSLGRRSSHEDTDFSAASGLTGNGDTTGVAAELFDIVMNPLQSLYHILYTKIHGLGIFSAKTPEIGETQNIQTMIYGYGDDVSFQGESSLVIARQVMS